MGSSDKKKDSENYDPEEHLRDLLINKTIKVWLYTATALFLVTQLRSFNIGWGYRDLIHFALFTVMFFLIVFRDRISTKKKGIALVFVCFVVAVAGSYTLGIFSGGVFFFPLAAVIVALFYPTRVVVIFVLSTIIIISLISYGHLTGYLTTSTEFEKLLSSKSNWVAYLSSFVFFLIISCVAITVFRNSSGKLIMEISKKSRELEITNQNLNEAIREIKKLSGLLPICVKCKKIKDEEGYWNQIETYIQEHSDAQFSHGLCDSCSEKLYGEEEWFKDFNAGKNKN